MSRWLVVRDRHDEARAVLAALEGRPDNDPYIIAQFKEIQYSVQYEREHAIKWSQLHKSDPEGTKPLRRLLLGAGTQLMQQFGGELI